MVVNTKIAKKLMGKRRLGGLSGKLTLMVTMM